MKHISNSQFAFSNRRLLIGLFFVLLSASLALVGLGAISKGSGDTKQINEFAASSERLPLTPSNTQRMSRSETIPHRYLDEKGNRATGIKPGPAVPAKHRGERPAGNGAWVSLGPPGGDVFDAAASTVDANIVLAGLAPGGSFGGTLYRSTDGGNTWSEVQALDGTSVFDIEFAPDGDEPTSVLRTVSGKARTAV